MSAALDDDCARLLVFVRPPETTADDELPVGFAALVSFWLCMVVGLSHLKSELDDGMFLEEKGPYCFDGP